MERSCRSGDPPRDIATAPRKQSTGHNAGVQAGHTSAIPEQERSTMHIHSGLLGIKVWIAGAIVEGRPISRHVGDLNIIGELLLTTGQNRREMDASGIAEQPSVPRLEEWQWHCLAESVQPGQICHWAWCKWSPRGRRRLSAVDSIDRPGAEV
jgi:hypothetical protein